MDPEIIDRVPWGVILPSTEEFESHSRFMRYDSGCVKIP